MKKKLFIFLIVTISAISGCLITLGVLAYFALSPNFKYKYVNFDEIDGEVTFENFSVSQELSSSTGNPFLHLKRKGVGFGTIGTNLNGTELIQLFDSNRRMTIMLSFKDEQVDRLALVYDGAGKYGARYDSNDSGWEYAWWTESGPDDIGYFWWDINLDERSDVKIVMLPSEEEDEEFIFYEKNWIPVNKYYESDNRQAKAEDDKNKYFFDKTSGLWRIEGLK